MNRVKKVFIPLVLLFTFICPVFLRSKPPVEPQKVAHEFSGSHLLIDFWGVDVPDTVAEIEDLLQRAALQAKSTLLKIDSHKFDPQGVTSFALLEESHISIHTWPEHRCAAIDVFTCGKNMKPHKALEYLIAHLKPEKMNVCEVERGAVTHKVWGQEVILDLFGCDHETICSGEKIKQFSQELSKLINMEAYGEPFIKRFALDDPDAAGYSLAQMITTSLVSAHFSEKNDSVYLNIFSCKSFDSDVASNFAQQFFGAKECKMRVLIR